MKCPRGKEEVNGKCLKKCKRNFKRNPSTNRCKKKSKSKSKKKLSPCKSGYERVSKKCLKKCKSGYKRNQTTNRCKKTGEEVVTGPSLPSLEQPTRELISRRVSPSPVIEGQPEPETVIVETTLQNMIKFALDHGYNINRENLLQYIQNVRNLPRDSESHSRQAIIDYQNVLGVIKVWTIDEPCLGAEFLIYKYITPFLYFEEICPNVLIPMQVGRTEKKDIKPFLRQREWKKLLKSDKKDVDYVMTPFFKYDLDSYLNKIKFKKYLNMICFVIFYNIAAYSKIGLRHNDLHISNVRVNELNNSTTENYKVGDTVYQVNSDIDLIIFDFDRSGLDNPGQKWLKDIGEDYNSVSCVRNSDQFCKEFYQCIKADGGRNDVWMFLIHLSEKAKELKIGNMMEPILKMALTNKGYKRVVDSNILKKNISDKKFWDLCLIKESELKTLVHPANDIISDLRNMNVLLDDHIKKVTTYGNTYSYEDGKVTESKFKQFYNQYYN